MAGFPSHAGTDFQRFVLILNIPARSCCPATIGSSRRSRVTGCDDSMSTVWQSERVHNGLLAGQLAIFERTEVHQAGMYLMDVFFEAPFLSLIKGMGRYSAPPTYGGAYEIRGGSEHAEELASLLRTAL